jgi:hypothetical protein
MYNGTDGSSVCACLKLGVGGQAAGGGKYLVFCVAYSSMPSK